METHIHTPIESVELLLPRGLPPLFLLCAEISKLADMKPGLKTLVEQKEMERSSQVLRLSDFWVEDLSSRAIVAEPKDLLKRSPTTFILKESMMTNEPFLRDITPMTRVLDRFPEGYNVLGALAEQVDNAVQAVLTSPDNNLPQVRVTLNSKLRTIVIYDNGPGMNACDITRWSRLGSSTHRDEHYKGLEGPPPFLTPNFGKYGVGGLGAALHLGRRVAVTSKTKGNDDVTELVMDQDVLQGAQPRWTAEQRIRRMEPAEKTELPSFTKVKISRLNTSWDVEELQKQLKDVYFPYIQDDVVAKEEGSSRRQTGSRIHREIVLKVNGIDLAEVDGGEVATTNKYSCTDDPFVVDLTFERPAGGTQDASAPVTPGRKRLESSCSKSEQGVDRARARLTCRYFPFKDEKETLQKVAEESSVDPTAASFNKAWRLASRWLGRLLPNAKWDLLPFMVVPESTKDLKFPAKDCCRRVRAFLDCNAGFKPTTSKMDLEVSDEFTAALKHLGESPDKLHKTKARDVRVTIKANRRTLSMKELKSEYLKWLKASHEKFDEAISYSNQKPEYYFPAHPDSDPYVDGKGCGVFHNMIKVATLGESVEWQKGQHFQISGGILDTGEGKGGERHFVGTIERFFHAGPPENAGPGMVICRPLGVEAEEGSTLSDSSIELGKSRMFSAEQLRKAKELDSAQWRKLCESSTPHHVELAASQAFANVVPDFEPFVISNCVRAAGSLLPRTVVALLRPLKQPRDPLGLGHICAVESPVKLTVTRRDTDCLALSAPRRSSSADGIGGQVKSHSYSDSDGNGDGDSGSDSDSRDETGGGCLARSGKAGWAAGGFSNRPQPAGKGKGVRGPLQPEQQHRRQQQWTSKHLHAISGGSGGRKRRDWRMMAHGERGSNRHEAEAGDAELVYEMEKMPRSTREVKGLYWFDLPEKVQRLTRAGRYTFLFEALRQQAGDVEPAEISFDVIPADRIGSRTVALLCEGQAFSGDTGNIAARLGGQLACSIDDSSKGVAVSLTQQDEYGNPKPFDPSSKLSCALLDLAGRPLDVRVEAHSLPPVADDMAICASDFVFGGGDLGAISGKGYKAMLELRPIEHDKDNGNDNSLAASGSSQSGARGDPAARLPVLVYPGVAASAVAHPPPAGDGNVLPSFHGLKPGTEVIDFLLTAYDAHGNCVDPHQSLEVALHNCEFLEGKERHRRLLHADNNGEVNLGSHLRVGRGFGCYGSMRVFNSLKEKVFEGTFQTAERKLVCIPNEVRGRGEAVGGVEVHFVDGQGARDDSENGSLEVEWDPGCLFKFCKGRAIIRRVPLPAQIGRHLTRIKHSGDPSLECSLKVVVEPREARVIQICTPSEVRAQCGADIDLKFRAFSDDQQPGILSAACRENLELKVQPAPAGQQPRGEAAAVGSGGLFSADELVDGHDDADEQVGSYRFKLRIDADPGAYTVKMVDRSGHLRLAHDDCALCAGAGTSAGAVNGRDTLGPGSSTVTGTGTGLGTVSGTGAGTGTSVPSLAIWIVYLAAGPLDKLELEWEEGVSCAPLRLRSSGEEPEEKKWKQRQQQGRAVVCMETLPPLSVRAKDAMGNTCQQYDGREVELSWGTGNGVSRDLGQVTPVALVSSRLRGGQATFRDVPMRCHVTAEEVRTLVVRPTGDWPELSTLGQGDVDAAMDGIEGEREAMDGSFEEDGGGDVPDDGRGEADMRPAADVAARVDVRVLPGNYPSRLVLVGFEEQQKQKPQEEQEQEQEQEQGREDEGATGGLVVHLRNDRMATLHLTIAIESADGRRLREFPAALSLQVPSQGQGPPTSYSGEPIDEKPKLNIPSAQGPLSGKVQGEEEWEMVETAGREEQEQEQEEKEKPLKFVFSGVPAPTAAGRHVLVCSLGGKHCPSVNPLEILVQVAAAEPFQARLRSAAGDPPSSLSVEEDEIFSLGVEVCDKYGNVCSGTHELSALLQIEDAGEGGAGTTWQSGSTSRDTRPQLRGGSGSAKLEGGRAHFEGLQLRGGRGGAFTLVCTVQDELGGRVVLASACPFRYYSLEDSSEKRAEEDAAERELKIVQSERTKAGAQADDLKEQLESTKQSLKERMTNVETLEAKTSEAKEALRSSKELAIQKKDAEVLAELRGRPVRTAATVRQELAKCPQLSAFLQAREDACSFLADGQLGADEVLGVVAQLARVEDANLNRAISEYLGDSMLAIVCKSEQGVQLLEGPDDDGSAVTPLSGGGGGLRGWAAAHHCPVEASFDVLNVASMEESLCEVPEGSSTRTSAGKGPLPWARGSLDSEALLDMRPPKAHSSLVPQGFLGYAVNMLHVRPRAGALKNGRRCGLRKALFSPLLGGLQVYDTGRHLRDAVKGRGLRGADALSLDGAMLKRSRGERTGRGPDPPAMFESITYGKLTSESLLVPSAAKEALERQELIKNSQRKFEEKSESLCGQQVRLAEDREKVTELTQKLRQAREELLRWQMAERAAEKKVEAVRQKHAPLHLEHNKRPRLQ